MNVDLATAVSWRSLCFLGLKLPMGYSEDSVVAASKKLQSSGGR